jgi:hypothetical protein
MAVSTVNISFQEDLLGQIIERKKKWESIFAYGESLSSKYKNIEKKINENSPGCQYICIIIFLGW